MDITELLGELNESCKPQCLARENLLLTGQLLRVSPCLSLTGTVALGKSGSLVLLLRKVGRIGS